MMEVTAPAERHPEDQNGSTAIPVEAVAPFHFFGFGFPAERIAIAMAWSRGRPALSSVRMLELIVFWLEPFLSGLIV